MKGVEKKYNTEDLTALWKQIASENNAVKQQFWKDLFGVEFGSEVKITNDMIGGKIKGGEIEEINVDDLLPDENKTPIILLQPPMPMRRFNPHRNQDHIAVGEATTIRVPRHIADRLKEIRERMRLERIDREAQVLFEEIDENVIIG